jgi:hypothetical protein
MGRTQSTELTKLNSGNSVHSVVTISCVRKRCIILMTPPHPLQLLKELERTLGLHRKVVIRQITSRDRNRIAGSCIACKRRFRR